MFQYEKKLQYPLRIKNPSPKLASVIISQYGGPDGELGASLRYLSQRFAMPYPELKGLLTDIGTEESAPSKYSYPARHLTFSPPCLIMGVSGRGAVFPSRPPDFLPWLVRSGAFYCLELALGVFRFALGNLPCCRTSQRLS